ncbi:MAG: hypothetical protein D6681_04865 [Calditrichaeota bacterium]|nr:MAG: hypothetical protein D6681_04865 [Calditrichota bacterium]
MSNFPKRKGSRRWKPSFRTGGWARFILSVLLIATTIWAGEEKKSPSRSWLTAPNRVIGLRTAYLHPMKARTVLIHWGYEFRDDWIAPVSELRGNLNRYGVLGVEFYLSENVSLRVRGIIHQVLHPEALPGGMAALESARDVGDFTITTLAQLVAAGKYHPAIGLRLSTTLPNTNQDRGLGPNTTDITLAIVLTHRIAGLTVFSDVGVAILAAPQLPNVQNDVLAYGLGLMWQLHPRLLLSAEVNGIHSTRRFIPRGTEDRSLARVGVTWRLPYVSVEIFPTHGLLEREGKWGVLIEANWQLNLLSRRGKP